MHYKGEGDTSKRVMIILFSRSQIVEGTSGYYKSNTQLHYLPDFFLILLLFHPLCFLLTPTVFLPLFAGEFHKGR